MSTETESTEELRARLAAAEQKAAALEALGQQQGGVPVRAFEIDPHERALVIVRLSSYPDPTAQQLVQMLTQLKPIHADGAEQPEPGPKPNRRKRRASKAVAKKKLRAVK